VSGSLSRWVQRRAGDRRITFTELAARASEEEQTEIAATLDGLDDRALLGAAIDDALDGRLGAVATRLLDGAP
jgi:hypothetical protein